MHITERRTKTILEYLQGKHDLAYAKTYGEKGYDDPAIGILFANWNPISREIMDYLEAAGYSLEWQDEWATCDAGKAYRTAPDSYDWVCAVSYDRSGELLTPDTDISDWIEARQVTNENFHEDIGRLPDWITAGQLEEQGFTKMEGTFESGHHAGQADDPRAIARKALAEGAEAVVFRLKGSSQFSVVFEGFSKAKEEENDV